MLDVKNIHDIFANKHVLIFFQLRKVTGSLVSITPNLNVHSQLYGSTHFLGSFSSYIDVHQVTTDFSNGITVAVWIYIEDFEVSISCLKTFCMFQITNSKKIEIFDDEIKMFNFLQDNKRQWIIDGSLACNDHSFMFFVERSPRFQEGSFYPSLYSTSGRFSSFFFQRFYRH